MSNNGILGRRGVPFPDILPPTQDRYSLPTFSPPWGHEGGSDTSALGPVSHAALDEISVLSEQQSESTPGPLEFGSAPLGHQMVYQVYLEHISRGLAPLKAASELIDAAQFHSDWMGTPQHYDIISSSAYREAGGGYTFSDTPTCRYYGTMDLGSRNDSREDPVYPAFVSNEAWSTSSLDVDLCLYGGDWPASQMRFRNEGGSWSSRKLFSAHKAWTLSCSGESPPTV